MRAIRGAITVSANTASAITEATCCLLEEIARRNDLKVDEIVSIFFTLTSDINASFPARAARDMGWDVPMLDMQEVDVPGAVPRCIRVLVHVERNDSALNHAYLRDARQLRPDLEA